MIGVVLFGLWNFAPEHIIIVLIYGYLFNYERFKWR